MKDLRHPARPVFDNESDVDVTIHPDDESDVEEVEDYHSKFLWKYTSYCLEFSV